jgi:hypothetical protein
MSLSLKFVEVFIILVAGIAFFYWQFRDLKKSREETRKQLETKEVRALDTSIHSQTAQPSKANDGR